MKTRKLNKQKKNQNFIKSQKLKTNELLQIRGGDGDSIWKDID